MMQKYKDRMPSDFDKKFYDSSDTKINFREGKTPRKDIWHWRWRQEEKIAGPGK